MNEATAAANLAVIRTLMERSAVYRRALVPILTTAGTVAVLAAIAGVLLGVGTGRAFFCYWMGVAVVVLLVAFGLARRQASRDREAFWSAPTRRVAQALALPLALGGILTLLLSLSFGDSIPGIGLIVVCVWLACYGCALHAAGFFAPPGMRVLGWLFGLAGMACFVAPLVCDLQRFLPDTFLPHAWMGLTFGGFHLAYALYLKLTGTGSAEA